MQMNAFHEKCMRLAIHKAREGIEKGQTPFGACIVKNEEVISCTHNIVWQTMDITAHAEMNAIREACKKLNTVDLSGCVIYSTCEPCPMCFSACHWAKITKIMYGTRVDDAKKIGFNELTILNKEMKRFGNSPVEIAGDLLREENLELFKIWYNRTDKRVY
ncbi:MAG: nucleoside deaminase [Candidatus Jettenia sp.]|nr:MAG: nucleoside deaminase [Candidatus Jettenia sp. AMX1]MBC6927774.1 nucleoside deaminase [Candidatus Jettenia sp.]GIL21093.1 MAG: tRNA-specific adenosine deaminase [Candidatus Jettenia caeni]MCE7879483.1 nucleoside deaminase [Candidatus Jettenia sp. AMX1]MCQ3926095.1 nucleoside deaminase [Candidatus Jettenia sp.]